MLHFALHGEKQTANGENRPGSPKKKSRAMARTEKPVDARDLSDAENDLLSHMEQSWQLETDSLGGNPVLRDGESDEVIRPTSANRSTVEALEKRGLIVPGNGGEDTWNLSDESRRQNSKYNREPRMPIQHWLDRDKHTIAAERVPYRLLEVDDTQSAGDPETPNMLIQGDNLEALKALLPYYAGRVK